MAGNGWEWMEMCGKCKGLYMAIQGCTFAEMAISGWTWLEWLERAEHGVKWLECLEMAVNGCKWLEIAGNGWNFWLG